MRPGYAVIGLATTFALLFGMVASSCGPRQQPEIPVYASPIDLTLLAGRWSGEYSSRDGRSGQIIFELEPGTSTAHGEVYMYPEVSSWREQWVEGEYGGQVLERRTNPPPIAVEFVWTEGGYIQGTLVPYQDPELNRTLQTGFRGTWEGETIEGRFTSRDGSRDVREGWWRVVRTGGAVEGSPTKGRDLSYEELTTLGRQVFETRGCVACHTNEDPVAGVDPVAPDLDTVVRHRTFPWIYHMVVEPDSMLRDDPAARELMTGYGLRMRDLEVTPWEALLLYEYLVNRAIERRTQFD